jgi:hypothetical protein
MTQITLDATLAGKLQDLTQAVELCDPSGRVLGQFTPAAIPPGGNGRKEPHLSEEELQRREQEPDYSTAEVLAYLENL